MSAPRTIPANTSLLLVGTSSFSKTFILPAISSNPGRLLIFKDIYGSFFTSSVFLSTTGMDGFENNVCTMTLKTNYGAWTFMNDGLTNWHLIDTYKNTLAIKGIVPNVLRIDYAWYGSSYKIAGANVTATVLSIFNSGRTSFVAGNGELGDPQSGVGKSFWIDYYPPNSTVLKQSFFPGENNTVTFANLT